jgi:beta-galactosidase GanA
MWPPEEWPQDVAKMKEVGFTLVRLFEFAWKRFEPTEGNFDFDWAIEILDQLHEAGIKVMIGTPTAAPPAWLTSKHPEVLKTNADGKCETHGQRKHFNPHSAVYREHCGRIVRAMVDHLGNHPAVHSWQIDNEMSGYDYGEETKAAFHRWLEKKYGSIEELNREWGLQFWSQAYDCFDQIPLVVAALGSREAPERHHPSLLMALAAFQNHGWKAFIDNQVAIIREALPEQPITTNMTGTVSAMDWFRLFQGLDRSGASMYADLSYYHYNYIRFDRLRAEKKQPFWLLETAPNWSGGGPIWNIHHDERGIRAFTWISMLMGGSMVLYWQWRSHWAGQEMQHGTCLSQTGAWMPGKETWKRIASEFRQTSDFLIANPVPQAPIGIMVDCESCWVNSIDPIHERNHYLERIRDDFQLNLQKAHFHRDLIHPERDWSGYKLLVIPYMPILGEAVKARLAEWVEKGGILILGPLTGYRTEENTLHRQQAWGGLEALIGAEQALRFSPHWVEDTIQIVDTDGDSSHPSIWCDAFSPEPETEVIASYKGGYGDGLASIVQRQLGKGTVLSFGCPIAPGLWLKHVARLAKSVEIRPMAEGSSEIVVSPRADESGSLTAFGLVNAKKEAQKITLPAGGTDLLTGDSVSAEVEMEPLAVKIIRFR